MVLVYLTYDKSIHGVSYDHMVPYPRYPGISYDMDYQVHLVASTRCAFIPYGKFYMVVMEAHV